MSKFLELLRLRRHTIASSPPKQNHVRMALEDTKFALGAALDDLSDGGPIKPHTQDIIAHAYRRAEKALNETP